MSRSGVNVREADWLDILLLAPRLRRADIDECEALFGKGSLNRAMTETFAHATLRKTVEVDGVPIAMFGVSATSLLSDTGHPWMFGTPTLDRQSRALITVSRHYIAHMLTLFPRLENIVDARNVKSIRWLRRLGFEVTPAEPRGAQGLPFHRFVMEV
jgi:hypothetical protein